MTKKKDFYFVLNVVVKAKDSDEALDKLQGLKEPKDVSIEDCNEMDEDVNIGGF